MFCGLQPTFTRALHIKRKNKEFSSHHTMGDSGNTVSCTLCLYTGPDNDFEEIGEVTKILPAIFVKKNFQLSARKIICHACKKKLQEAFHFKCSCIGTEDFLVPFTAVAEPSEVDLREVYMKKNMHGKDTRIGDDQSVCRLCLGLVVGTSTFLMQESVRQMIQNFIPELVLESTHHPVACEACTKSLYSHMLFINNCLYVRMNRSKSVQEKAQNTDAATHTNQDDAQQEVNTRSKSKVLYVNLGTVKCSETDQIIPQTKPFSCDLCEFETRHQAALKAHKKYHKKHSKKKLHHCKECGYYTKYGTALRSHNLKHMKPSDIKFYRCEECDYKSKYRSALKSHQLGHKKPSEIPMKKCDVCSYETKHRTALVLHKLKHMRPSQIKMYKCNKCEFQTKFKHALKPHKSTRHKVGK